MYVPPVKSIEMVLQHEQVLNFIATETPRDDDVISSYCDAHAFKTHEFIQRHLNEPIKPLRLKIFHDGLETTNGLGSRKSVHKVEGFYMKIDNIPQRFQSMLGCTFLVALVNEQDLRRYGFREVLTPLLEDLQSLESEGVQMVVNGEVVVVRAVLTAYCGDTEAVHDIFGLMGAGANHFCRLCLISREELHTGEVFIGEKRTRINHAEQLVHVAQNAKNASLYGLREDSVLNDLQYFHTKGEWGYS